MDSDINPLYSMLKQWQYGNVSRQIVNIQCGMWQEICNVNVWSMDWNVAYHAD